MKSGRITTLIISVFIIFLAAAFCHADEIAFEASVSTNKAEVNSSINLALTFTGSQNIPAPELGQLDGFSWRYIGPSTRISIINGKQSSAVSHNYLLVPIKTGMLTVPAIEVKYRNDVYRSEPVHIEVFGKGSYQQAQPHPGSASGVTEGMDDRIFLVINANKRQAYAGERIPVTVSLFINSLAVRDIQYPQFAHEGFSAEAFQAPRQYTKVIGGINYDVVEFQTSLYALRPGSLVLGPAEINCSLVYKKSADRRRSSLFGGNIFGSDMFDDFFVRYESQPVKLESKEFPIEIMPLPAENRPDSFTGAVGSYGMSVKASPAEVIAGDPITLYVEIQGAGNFNTVEMPSLRNKNDFKVYEPEVSQSLSKKSFQQVIIPLNHAIREIPEVSFSFFDPSTKAYRTITKGPIPVNVLPVPKDREFKIFSSSQVPGAGGLKEEEELGRDIVYVKENPGVLEHPREPFCQSVLFYILFFMPPLSVAAAFFIKRRNTRLSSDVRYARKQRALKKASKNLKILEGLMKKNDKEHFFEQASKTIKQYLGDKFHLPTGGITKDDIVPCLEKSGIDKAAIVSIEDFFNACDAARYAPSGIKEEDMPCAYRMIKEIIGKMEKARI
jgi:hypothetical protein